MFQSTTGNAFAAAPPHHVAQVQLVPANGDMARARRSFDAIRTAFRALETSIYADKLGILVDRQNDPAQLERFKADNPELERRGQVRESPVGSLEEAYPPPWRKTAAEVQGMSGDRKVELARTAGAAITQEQFEAEMPGFHTALQSAWELAFA